MSRSAVSIAFVTCLWLVSACGGDPGSEPAGDSPAAQPEKQVLYGDLHVHTTYSWDAFLFSLPLSGGEGAHPPDDACDFARYCASLDFFAVTDHAESLLPEHWAETKESVRRCNARAGGAEDPELVAFTGFEWSQAADAPNAHWGHRCVIYPGTGETELPKRPIGAVDRAATFQGMAAGMRMAADEAEDGAPMLGYAEYLESLSSLPICADPPLAAQTECRELAATPGDLHRRLDEQGLESLAIPHGTNWGIYTPATSSIERQLSADHYDPRREKLIEIMSGHGSAEEYRPWRALEITPEGDPICPRVGVDYLPCCRQAEKLARRRCEDPSSPECDAAGAAAMQKVVDSWDIGADRAVPDASAEEWLDCGQCRGCFKPGFGSRPMQTAQYAMALSNTEETGADGRPLRFRYGFIGSSDGHSGRPGTGYKQVERLGMMTDANPPAPTPELALLRERALGPVDQRIGSFLYPGGLVAVHAYGRSRQAIWDALQRREVYATSGPRIQLWFDLRNGPAGRVPMGSEVVQASTPRFEVRAVGSFVQLPGCPDRGADDLSPERRSRLCRDECYNPGVERRRIERIEVVRIRPQIRVGEPVEPLIEDPWQIFPCPDDPLGCVVQFRDEDFLRTGRDALYYARAIEERSRSINGEPLETEFDSFRRATHTRPCTPESQDPNCLGTSRERAWSSPIFLNHAQSSRRGPGAGSTP